MTDRNRQPGGASDAPGALRTPSSTAVTLLDALRGRRMTVDELAETLDITGNAVRAQLANLERDGYVRAVGVQRGATRPARLYGLTPRAELLFSRIYVPLLDAILQTLAHDAPAALFERTFRRVARILVGDRAPADGTLGARARAASALWNEFGGMSTVRRERGQYVIRSAGCPLASVTAAHPEGCAAMQVVLSEFAGVRVERCCVVGTAPHCCFVIGASD